MIETSRIAVLATLLVLAGCESDDPAPTDAGSRIDTGVPGGPDASGTDAGLPDAGSPDAGAVCEPLATDFVRAMPAADGWPACASSDDGTYDTFAASVSEISSVARVAAFEDIVATLRWIDRVPAPADFTDARDAYSTAEGIGSRVTRRSDEHFSMGGMLTNAVCRSDMGGTPEMYPDYCAGPQKIARVIGDAFAAGQTGVDPVLQAARIEAGLLWFLAISVYKESLTCTTNPSDCDSAFVKLTGGMPPPMGVGLARYLREVAPEAESRGFDGILAMRCWRELDPAIPASDAALRDRARAQIDRAVLFGVAQLVKDRLARMRAAAGDLQRAYLEFARVLGGGRLWPDAPECGRCRGFLEYHVEQVSPADGEIVRAELDRTDAAPVDVDAVIAALDRAFPCP